MVLQEPLIPKILKHFGVTPEAQTSISIPCWYMVSKHIKWVCSHGFNFSIHNDPTSLL